MAIVGRPLSSAFHVGLSARPLSVRHTPPPADAAQTRQSPFFRPQSGATASPVLRPDVTESRRLSVVSPGAVPVVGPSRLQSAPSWPCPLKALRARLVLVALTVFAG